MNNVQMQFNIILICIIYSEGCTDEDAPANNEVPIHLIISQFMLYIMVVFFIILLCIVIILSCVWKSIVTEWVKNKRQSEWNNYYLSPKTKFFERIHQFIYKGSCFHLYHLLFIANSFIVSVHNSQCFQSCSRSFWWHHSFGWSFVVIDPDKGFLMIETIQRISHLFHAIINSFINF